MPRYVYKCEACQDFTLTTFDAIDEFENYCGMCFATGSLKRDYAGEFTEIKKPSQVVQKTGEYTKEFIEESRKELEYQKLEMEQSRGIKNV